MLGKTVAECQRQVDCDEFLDWRAYMRMELPVGDRLEVMLANMTHWLMHCWVKGGPTPEQLLLPEWPPKSAEEESRDQHGTDDPQAVREKLLARMAAAGVRVRRKDRAGDEDEGGY